jgi:hypothetical protein
LEVIVLPDHSKLAGVSLPISLSVLVAVVGIGWARLLPPASTPGPAAGG